LCEQFGVSRTPVRSVLQELRIAGLIEVTPYKSTRVTQLDFDTICQQIYLRNAVESAVMTDFAAACTPEQLAQLKTLFSILKNIAPLPPSVNDTPQHLDDCLIRVYDFATHSGTLRATIMLTNHKVYLKSRKCSLFLQPQLDFALKTLESIKDSCGF